MNPVDQPKTVAHTLAYVVYPLISCLMACTLYLSGSYFLISLAKYVDRA